MIVTVDVLCSSDHPTGPIALCAGHNRHDLWQETLSDSHFQ